MCGTWLLTLQVIFRFEVRVYVLQSVGLARSQNLTFLLTLKEKNYPEKVVSFTIQTKINLYMFRTQFLVNKKKIIFDE